MDIRLLKAPCGFLSTNDHGFITEVNETFLKWTSYDENTLLGKHIEVLLSPTNKIMFHSYFYPTIQLKNRVEEFYIRMKDAERQSLPFLLNAKRYTRDGEDVIDYILMKMQHRMEYENEMKKLQKQAEQAYVKKSEAFDHLEQIYAEIEQKQHELLLINSGLEEISNTDNLTQLFNRRYFSQKVVEAIRAYEMEDELFSLWIVDIDFFKKVNDTYGHQSGDQILVELAAFLKQFIGEKGIVCRFGGEEFTILVQGHPDELAIALQQAVDAKVWPIVEKLTISIGVTHYREGDTEKTLIECADQALYHSKQNGRNRASFYDQYD